MNLATTGDFGADLKRLIAAYVAEGHSVFRPSSATRWMTCAGSVWAEIKAQADRAGIDAAYGTVAHAISEYQLRHGKRPTWAKPGRSRQVNKFVVEIDESMLSYVEQYVEWVRELGPGDVDAVETRVDFSDLTPLPDQGGTADHIHIARRVLTVTDLKFGTGVRVHAMSNKQAMLYAYGAWREWNWAYEIDKIVIRICQPRLEVFDTWEVSVDDLLAFAQKAREAAHKAWVPDAPRTPHPDACRFCTVKAGCPALAQLAIEAADDVFSDLDGREINPEIVSVPMGPIAPRLDPKTLSNDEMARILRWRAPFKAWFDTIHEELMRRASNGQPAPGWKVIEGRANRVWRDPEAAATLLLALGIPREKVFTQNLVSPARATDLVRALKKGKPEVLLKSLIDQPPGARSLVVAEDSRESIHDAGDDVFDDLA